MADLSTKIRLLKQGITAEEKMIPPLERQKAKATAAERAAMEAGDKREVMRRAAEIRLLNRGIEHHNRNIRKIQGEIQRLQNQV